MTKAEERALETYPEFIGAGFGCSCDYNQPQRTGFIKGYYQAIEDACEWIKQQQEMLEDCFSDAGDFADLLKQAMEE